MTTPTAFRLADLGVAMSGSILFLVLLAISLAAAPVMGAGRGQFGVPLRFVTMDGTWDCPRSETGKVATIVVVDKAYALIDAESKPAGYGKLFRIAIDETDLPNTIVVDGPLKELGYVGVSLKGPADDYENYEKGIFLVLVTMEKATTYCERRLTEGMVQ